MLSFLKCKRLRGVVFPFSKKHKCKQKLETKICIVTTISFTDEIRNTNKAFKFVSAVKNLQFII